MKFIKNFSVFESERINLPDETRDLFGIWTYFKFIGPIAINMDDDYFSGLDWSTEELLDRPDPHVATYSIEAEDDDSVLWAASQDIIDGHLEGDVDMSNLEIVGGESFFRDQIKSAFESKGFKFIFDNKYNTAVKTDATWEDIEVIFPEFLESSGMGKKEEFLMDGETINPLYTIRFDLKEVSGKNSTSYLYVRMRDGRGIWSAI